MTASKIARASAAPPGFPYPHRPMSEVIASERVVVEPPPRRLARAQAAAEGNPTFQRRCRVCGHWRVTACLFSLCPLRPEAA